MAAAAAAAVVAAAGDGSDDDGVFSSDGGGAGGVRAGGEETVAAAAIIASDDDAGGDVDRPTGRSSGGDAATRVLGAASGAALSAVTAADGSGALGTATWAAEDNAKDGAGTAAGVGGLRGETDDSRASTPASRGTAPARPAVDGQAARFKSLCTGMGSCAAGDADRSRCWAPPAASPPPCCQSSADQPELPSHEFAWRASSNSAAPCTAESAHASKSSSSSSGSASLAVSAVGQVRTLESWSAPGSAQGGSMPWPRRSIALLASRRLRATSSQARCRSPFTLRTADSPVRPSA